jgi:cell pole-organizing protein PopZ
MTIGQEMEALRAKYADQSKAVEAVNATLAEVTLERDGLKAKAVEENAAHVKAIADLTAQHDAAIAAAKVASDELAAKVASEQAAKVAAVSEFEALKKAVAQNPAFAQAAAKGQEKPTAEGGTPDGAGTFASKEEAEKEYRKITDPAAQVEFRKQNKEILGL